MSFNYVESQWLNTDGSKNMQVIGGNDMGGNGVGMKDLTKDFSATPITTIDLAWYMDLE